MKTFTLHLPISLSPFKDTPSTLKILESLVFLLMFTLGKVN